MFPAIETLLSVGAVMAMLGMFVVMVELPRKRSTRIAIQAAASFVVGLMIAYLIWGIDAAGPELDRSVAFLADSNDVILCLVGNGCESHPLAGQQVAAIDGELGIDPDRDSVNEWTCTRQSPLIPSQEALELMFQKAEATALGDGPSTDGRSNAESAFRCLERVTDAGPASDSFLLTDRQTVVERIDIDGDGRADLIKVGDEESKPIPRGVPWWQTLIGPSVLVAIVGGVFAVTTNRLTTRQKSEGGSTPSTGGETSASG